MAIQFKDCKKNASTINKIIDTMLPIISVTFNYNKKLNLGDFNEALGNVEYALNIRSTLLSLKKENCQYDSNLVKKLEEQLHKIKSHTSYMIEYGDFSYAEKLVLSKIEDVGGDRIYEDDLEKYYNAKTLELSNDFDKFVKEVNSFNYKKYGHDKAKITKDFNDLIAKFKDHIASFEKLVAEHGEAIVNWGDHKITRLGIDYGTVRKFIRDYQESLLKKGVARKEKSKSDSVQKSRENPNKTQDDLFRLFKAGNKDEAKAVAPQLNLENIKTLFTAPIKSVEDRVRENSQALVSTFCNLDDGSDFLTVYNYAHRGTWNHNTIPMSYLFKVVDHPKAGLVKANLERVLALTKSSREFMEIPDTFFDKILKGIDLKEVLNMNHLVTDAVMTRMTNDEVCNVIKRMAGCDGVFLLVGLDVVKDNDNVKKMEVRLSKQTVKKFDNAIYDEVKDFLFDINGKEDFDDMVVANKDKVMARRMIGSNCGDYVKLFSIFNYNEKLKIIKSRINQDGDDEYTTGISVHKIYTQEEQKTVFAELLKLNHPNAVSYLEEQWNYVSDRYFFHSYDDDEEVSANKPMSKKERVALVAEYVAMLESIKTQHAFLEGDMPKRTRMILLKNGVKNGVKRSAKDYTSVTSDFTREEYLECFELKDLKILSPSKLTTKELIDFAEKDSVFLKDYIELFPESYLKKKFAEEEVRKEFIGNRVLRENRIAWEKLQRKMPELKAA
jgi:hypothetical protein